MASALRGKRVAFLVANEGVEQIQLTEPWAAVRAAGGDPVLVAPKPGDIQAFNHLDRADRFAVDMTVDDALEQSFDALVLPGGVVNPDRLRVIPEAVHFARLFFEDGKPVATICHAAWTLIDAGVVRDRTITSSLSLRTDLTNAGAAWVDEAVCIDDTGPNTLISSRRPNDLPLFLTALVREFSAADARVS